MDDDTERQVKHEPGRRAVCQDCLGRGTNTQPRQMVSGGQSGTLMVPARCPTCRGEGYFRL